MLNALVANRWLLILRGVLAIIFGVLAFIWPGTTALTLVFLVAGYLVVDGVLSIIAAIRRRETNDRWWLGLLEGLVGIAAGIYAFFNPVPSAFALLIILAIWAVITGVLTIAAAIRLRREIDNEWTMGLMGLVSVILGIIIFLNPGAGLVGVVWAIGGYAIAFGVLMIILAVTAVRYARRVTTASPITDSDSGARIYENK